MVATVPRRRPSENSQFLNILPGPWHGGLEPVALRRDPRTHRGRHLRAGHGAAIDPGDTVVVENPGYRMAHHAFESQGARLAFVTPTHQFPLGSFLPMSRRHELLAWAARSGVRVYPVGPFFLPGMAIAPRPAGLVMGYALLECRAAWQNQARGSRISAFLGGGRE
jgi:hypothetical protein